MMTALGGMAISIRIWKSTIVCLPTSKLPPYSGASDSMRESSVLKVITEACRLRSMFWKSSFVCFELSVNTLISNVWVGSVETGLLKPFSKRSWNALNPGIAYTITQVTEASSTEQGINLGVLSPRNSQKGASAMASAVKETSDGILSSTTAF